MLEAPPRRRLRPAVVVVRLPVSRVGATLRTAPGAVTLVAPRTAVPATVDELEGPATVGAGA